ncbi:MAG: CRISPR-associated protein Cas4 [Melioribacteraceae bacterium]
MSTITPSHIIEYLFCPRFIYFQYVLAIPQHEEKSYKAIKGRNIHELKIVQNKDYLRKKIGAKEKHLDVYLTSKKLRGKIDEVLELNDGSFAPLDYKFAKYNDIVYSTYKTQLYCYALLIEENFNKKVTKGFIVYVRSKNKLITIDIEEAEKEKTLDIIEKVIEIINDNKYPKATSYKKRCFTCTYRNICIS